MRAINQAVGMSETLTYHYFPDGKLQILYAVIENLEEKRANDINQSIQSINPELPLREALFLIAQKMAERFEADQDFIQIMIQERGLLDINHIRSMSNIGGDFSESFRRFLELKCQAGEIRNMDFSMAVSQFFCHISMIALQSILYEPTFDPHNYMKNIEKILDFTASLWKK